MIVPKQAGTGSPSRPDIFTQLTVFQETSCWFVTQKNTGLSKLKTATEGTPNNGNRI